MIPVAYWDDTSGGLLGQWWWPILRWYQWPIEMILVAYWDDTVGLGPRLLVGYWDNNSVYIGHYRVYMYICNVHVCMYIHMCMCVYTVVTVPDIIKFTYYHRNSIDYSVLCEWSTLYFKCTTQLYCMVLHFSTMLSPY